MHSVLLFENEEDVGMRKPSLPEFHHIHIVSSSAHDNGIGEVINQLRSHEIEHSYHNIRPVLWPLYWKDGVCNYWPEYSRQRWCLSLLPTIN